MPEKHYDWSSGPPEIDVHSLAKHDILRRYVVKYIETLTNNHLIPHFPLTIIDGFSGGGEYRKDNRIFDGSPLILMKAIEEARVRVNIGRRKAIEIDDSYFFIEKSEVNFKYLSDCIDRRCREEDRLKISLRLGPFEEHLGAIVHQLKTQTARKGRHRAIFVLDQYGHSEVPLSLIKYIFNELPNAEIFLTMAVGFIAAYAKYDPVRLCTLVDQSLKINNDGIHIAPSVADQLVEVEVHDAETRAKMRVIQRRLQQIFVEQSGARYYTPFFIVSAKSARPYWFAHLANSWKANEVVKSLHWEINNHFEHYGDAEIPMLGYDPRKWADPNQLSLFSFDNTARSRTRESLREELPKLLLGEFSSGATPTDIYSCKGNETPADMSLLCEALQDVCADYSIELERRGHNGAERRPSTKIRVNDVIRLQKQRSLFDVGALRVPNRPKPK